MKTRVEWMIGDMGAMMNSITVVPFYDTLGEESITWMLSQTQLQTLLISNDIVLKLLRVVKANGYEKIQNLIVVDGITAEIEEKAAELGIKLYDFDELVRIGKTEPARSCELVKPNKRNLFTLCYTSGSTGIPKVNKLKINIITRVYRVRNGIMRTS